MVSINHGAPMPKKFHVARETRILDVFEVEAKDVDDAISLLELSEARHLNSTEGQPIVIGCWEKPTGISESES